ncbi:MAG: UDP-galactopyranose mutase [Bacteroidaceae bacterium]|nr:UDP-galactopyranose mutase [Bacteroidaceae bacterium]
MKQYDYLIVGTGLYGAVAAYLLSKKGKKCLLIDKRPHIGGNVYTEDIRGINVHKYGAHIFHTSNKKVWDFVNSFVEFNRYTNSPVANYKGELYNLPFNMNTFYQMWGVKTPAEAEAKIAEQKAEEVEKLKAKCEKLGLPCEPTNLEEQALMLVGRDIYEKLIKNYTEKQWGRKCTELPAFIIKRLPVRLIFDNNYFNDKYQGIPEGGYTKLVEAMIGDCEVRLSTDYFEHKAELDALADKVIYTGEIDRYYDYKFGHLQYRTVSFETELLEGVSNYQGNAVVNYTDSETPFTRIIEHKHFEFGNQPDTVISKEFSKEWQPGDEPYYPVNDERNSELYAKYKALAYAEKNVIFGGRLAEYKYYDMHKVIESAMEMVENLA